MSKILHIIASPRGERSASTTVAKAFIEAYKAAHPTDQIETLNLWEVQLPEFDGATIDAKYAILHGQEHSAEQAAAWKEVVNLAEHFKQADKYIISLPMWNFGIPYILKHYIDALLQPGLTFSFSPTEGYKGLVTGKPVVAIYARGGAYAPGTGAEAYDSQSPYLKQVLGFIGFTDIKEVFVEPTLAKADAVETATKHATEVASTF